VIAVKKRPHPTAAGATAFARPPRVRAMMPTSRRRLTRGSKPRRTLI
jgi:hypothetical protein